MRESQAAVALVRREQDGRTLWLAQWNPRWQRYNFVAGHKEPGESFRACLLREVGEELGLAEGADFEAAAEPAARLQYTAWSESASADTAYTVELFDVRLTADAERRVSAEPHNRWLSADEIRAGRCADGAPVSATMALWLAQRGPAQEGGG
jgi:8-oxo-dGTP pyrophosphatase MutT (NUDIX family)